MNGATIHAWRVAGLSKADAAALYVRVKGSRPKFAACPTVHGGGSEAPAPKALLLVDKGLASSIVDQKLWLRGSLTIEFDLAVGTVSPSRKNQSEPTPTAPEGNLRPDWNQSRADGVGDINPREADSFCPRRERQSGSSEKSA